MESINERFAEALAASGLSETALAKRLSVSQQTVNNWKLGNSKPKHLMDIARELGISAEWLRYGAGPRERKPDTGIVAAISALASALSEKEQQTLYKIAKSLQDDQKEPDKE